MQLSPLKANKLSINASKTNFIILGTPHMTSTKAREDLNVILDNTALERVKFTKFLGVLINECLTWKTTSTAYPKLYQEILMS